MSVVNIVYNDIGVNLDLGVLPGVTTTDLNYIFVGKLE